MGIHIITPNKNPETVTLRCSVCPSAYGTAGQVMFVNNSTCPVHLGFSMMTGTPPAGSIPQGSGGITYIYTLAPGSTVTFPAAEYMPLDTNAGINMYFLPNVGSGRVSFSPGKVHQCLYPNGSYGGTTTGFFNHYYVGTAFSSSGYVNYAGIVTFLGCHD